jgi:hypothetical protein
MNMLKLGVAAAISAAALPGTAEAATIVAGSTTVNANLDPAANNGFTIGFSDSNLANPFNEVLTFTTDVAGRLSINLTSTTTGAADDTDFSNVFLSGTGIAAPISIAQILADPNETRALNDFGVGVGTFTLNILGNPGTSSGSFGGSVAFTAAAAAVPEPGTWAMMLVGFGAIGFSMRRRRRHAAHLFQAA